MKFQPRSLMIIVVLIVGTFMTSQNVATQQTSVSFQLFYDQLSPYGTWVDYHDYGYVWIPDVDREFSPYGSDGRWIFTSDGWTWVSDYSWGWAPFHYGRWAYDDYYGWLWVPHNEWGPAWVTWRRSAGYYGWAPMGPGVSVELSFGGGYRVADERWRFVSERDFDRPDIDRHYVDRSTNVTIINNSTVINNTYVDNTRHTTYVTGPRRDDVQRATGTTINPVAIQENDRPGQTLKNDQLRIYRPRVQSTANTNERKPAPGNLVALNEVKPVADRKHGSQRQNDNIPVNGRDRSSQPQNPKSEQQVQPPNSPPKGNTPAKEPPVFVDPNENNRSPEHQPMPPNSIPKGKTPAKEPPVFVDPNENNRNPEHQPMPPNSNPKGNKKGGEPPVLVNPNEKNKRTDDQPRPQNGKSNNKHSGEQPTVVNENKNGAQPSQAPTVNGHQQNSKTHPSNSTLPPKNRKKEGQPPNSNREKPDSTKNHSLNQQSIL